MKYEKDIRDWTQKFAVEVVRMSIELKRKGVDYSLRDQLLRAGTSIGSNVKEGKASSSRKELIRYYEIALRSAGETEFWLDVIREGYQMETQKFSYIKNNLKEISNVIATIIINLKRNTNDF